MFTPEMMASAQKMMQNMSPEQMQQMTEMASKMDPKMMESMASGMGHKISATDVQRMNEQMKNMSPEQLKQGMSQASAQTNSRWQYMLNGATQIKNEGNELIRQSKYEEAIAKYERARQNVADQVSDEAKKLKQACLLNIAMCKLKLKEYESCVKICEEALSTDPNATKALFRRGQALAELGKLQKAVKDLRRAFDLSAEDPIKVELARVRKLMDEKGLQEEEENEEDADEVVEIPSAAKQSSASTLAGNPKSRAPGGGGSGGGGSSGSNSSSSGGLSLGQMSDAAEKLAKNPEMLSHATEMMKNMSPDQMQAMLQSMPGGAPAGMDPNMVKQQMETMQKNPEMVQSMMQKMSEMPEEERKKLLETRTKAMGGKDQAAAMKSMMENPDAMKQVMEMTKNISPDELAKMTGGNPEEAKMMQQAAEEMSKNPELGKQMAEMMKNMDPQEMEKMMQMSKNMREKRSTLGGESNGPVGDTQALGGAMGSMMNDPQMMRAAEDMMKSMKPETLSAMAKSQGMDLDEDKARMMTKMIPWVMKVMRGLAYCKSVVRRPREHWRVVVGIMIVILAFVQRLTGD